MNLIVTKTNVTVGEIVTIQCKLVIQGRPQPTISWYQNGKILEQTGIYFINNEEIQQKHAGSYECKATNDAGNSRSKVVMITVHKKPGDQDNGTFFPEDGYCCLRYNTILIFQIHGLKSIFSIERKIFVLMHLY